MSKVYTVYDQKAEAYKQPFFVRAHGEAIRAMTELVNDPEHQFHKYAEDYTLFYLGDWNEVDGVMEILQTKQNLGNLLEFKTSFGSPKLEQVAGAN